MYNKNLDFLFKKLVESSFETNSIIEIEKLIKEISNGFVTRTVSLPAKLIYRTRKNPTSNNFSHVSELSNPPIKNIKNFGRLNYPKQSIYYCSANELTSVLEIDPQVGDEITVIRNILTGTANIEVMEIGVNESFFRNKKGTFFIEKNKIEQNQKIHDFLIKEFTKRVRKGEEYKYKITAAISNVFISSQNIDGLLYPSIVLNQRHLNLGLKPKSFLKNYSPVDCKKVLVEKVIPNIGAQLRLVAISKEINKMGEIKWK